ncbi:MAG TPA: hypothetical protein PLK76_01960 [bacterium]|nr:hypothetical protein [bacterium]
MTKNLQKKNQQLAELIAWINSPEGQASIKKALAEADEFTARLAEDRKVPWQKMHEPITI